MKKYLLLSLILLLTLSATGYSQITKFRTTAFAYTTKDSEGNWEDWSDFEDLSLLVILDNDKSRVTIYSEERQTYDIIDTDEETSDGTTDDSGDQSWSFTAIDQDGDECELKMMVRYSQEDQRQEIYIIYDDYAWVYKIITLDEDES